MNLHVMGCLHAYWYRFVGVLLVLTHNNGHPVTYFLLKTYGLGLQIPFE